MVTILWLLIIVWVPLELLFKFLPPKEFTLGSSQEDQGKKLDLNFLPQREMNLANSRTL